MLGTPLWFCEMFAIFTPTRMFLPASAVGKFSYWKQRKSLRDLLDFTDEKESGTTVCVVPQFSGDVQGCTILHSIIVVRLVWAPLGVGQVRSPAAVHPNTLFKQIRDSQPHTVGCKTPWQMYSLGTLMLRTMTMLMSCFRVKCWWIELGIEQNDVM